MKFKLSFSCILAFSFSEIAMSHSRTSQGDNLVPPIECFEEGTFAPRNGTGLFMRLSDQGELRGFTAINTAADGGVGEDYPKINTSVAGESDPKTLSYHSFNEERQARFKLNIFELTLAERARCKKPLYNTCEYRGTLELEEAHTNRDIIVICRKFVAPARFSGE